MWVMLFGLAGESIFSVMFMMMTFVSVCFDFHELVLCFFLCSSTRLYIFQGPSDLMPPVI